MRFIGDPFRRIAEDHLRILRFFRFHARFGQGEPNEAALEACAARANDLMALSRERIADELLKLLSVADPSPTVAIMLDRGILRPVLPEIVPSAIERLRALIAAESDAGIEGEPLRRLSALLPPDASLAESVAVRLKLSTKFRKRLACAAEQDLDTSSRALAYFVGPECAVDRLLLAGRSGEAAMIAGWDVPRFPIGGGELIRRGLAAGPRVASTLRAIERTWADSGFPTDEPFEQLVTEALNSASS